MRSVFRVMVSVVAGLGMLSVSLIRLVWLPQPASTAALSTFFVRPVRPKTPFESALATGWRHRIKAQQAVNGQRDALEAWDPAMAYVDAEPLRQQLLADDRSGELRQALAHARRAVALARTRAEACRATLLLARTECDAGHHEAELRHARALHALARGEWTSQDVLRRAMLCDERLPSEPVGLP